MHAYTYIHTYIHTYIYGQDRRVALVTLGVRGRRVVNQLEANQLA
jgi:hypothetical protein